MYIGNKNTIPAISNLPGQGKGGTPTPPPGNFIALEINLPGLPDVVALESALTDKVELE